VTTRREPFGIVGVFASAESLTSAAQELRTLGFDAVEAYTPHPVEAVGEVLHPGRRRLLPAVVFVAAVAGTVWGYFVQYWGAVLDYPLDVGGRPLDSAPAFIVTTFETAVLFAVAAAFFGLLVYCRLPLLYHPIFEASDFARASRDRFVLCVEAQDPSFGPSVVRRVFERCGAERVEEVAGWRRGR
jgi:hypothetical protein